MYIITYIKNLVNDVTWIQPLVMPAEAALKDRGLSHHPGSVHADPEFALRRPSVQRVRSTPDRKATITDHSDLRINPEVSDITASSALERIFPHILHNRGHKASLFLLSLPSPESYPSLDSPSRRGGQKAAGMATFRIGLFLLVPLVHLGV